MVVASETSDRQRRARRLDGEHRADGPTSDKVIEARIGTGIAELPREAPGNSSDDPIGNAC